ncbi:MAG: helix-turn-helix domain-containing protein [Bacteroides sp.]|nr:helix-turn-helix domain-containing protein [Bacillota bacterium]MCM1394373.1 helix-turn-helix domain-containing protein [[Eubacterium] siraeum]MCM1456177.1 helix-turn-helix domain-containing protein [Bacteroides sp.]
MKKITYAERIKQLREEDGISQAKLAKAIGVNQSAIALWENGNRKPNSDAIIDLAAYFEVTTDYLLGVSDDSNPR